LLTEQEEVGPLFAGTALGIVVTLGNVGGFVGPMIGNALATANPAFPFILFGFLTGIFAIACFFVKETGARVRK
jgi:nitrate/nitrite transporter NarK